MMAASCTFFWGAFVSLFGWQPDDVQAQVLLSTVEPVKKLRYEDYTTGEDSFHFDFSYKMHVMPGRYLRINYGMSFGATPLQPTSTRK